MKKVIFTTLLLLTSLQLLGQTPKDFGYRHIQYNIDGEVVDVLVKSKKGEEQEKKPIIFSNQGSKPIPLIAYSGNRRTIPTMEEGFAEDDYHIVVVGKPGIPLMSHRDSLVEGKFYYEDKENYISPKVYRENNNLEYYVNRNLQVLDSLITESWVDTTKIVVTGHSQGSSIALYMCDRSPLPTHLIYSAGLPYYPTIMSIVARKRMYEKNEADSTIEKAFKTWGQVIDEPLNTNKYINRNSNKMLYSFSQNENEVLKRLRIPVLNSYGTEDESAPYHDLLRIETIRERLHHIQFNAYVGLGHAYQLSYPKNNTQKIDFMEDVVLDWLDWLKEN